jgi:RimJ/RimL family protein N-acetyltransferase
MADFGIRSVTEEDIRDFVTWHHEPPYDGYNITQPVDEAVEYFLQPSTNCHVIMSDDELAGFFTFGSDAQVPGGDYSAPGLDIGLGIKPSHTGGGRGRSFVEAVVRFARTTFEVDPLRVTIAVGNPRALRVWSNLGFVETQRFQSSETVMGSDAFVILEKSKGLESGW